MAGIRLATTEDLPVPCALLTDGDNAIGQRFCTRHGFIPPGMLAMRLMLDP